jgi:hypothetical protein
MTEYERFGLVFTKTRVYKFGQKSASKQAELERNIVFLTLFAPPSPTTHHKFTASE